MTDHATDAAFENNFDFTYWHMGIELQIYGTYSYSRIDGCPDQGIPGSTERQVEDMVVYHDDDDITMETKFIFVRQKTELIPVEDDIMREALER